MKKTIQFEGFTCHIEYLKYQNTNRTAIQLLDATEGDPVAMATINMPEVKLEENEVIIKDYSENEGILDVLISEGIVERTGKTVSTGFVTCQICKLLNK